MSFITFLQHNCNIMAPSSTLPINQNIRNSPSSHSVILLSVRGADPGPVMSSFLGMILLFWFLGWLWVQCYLTDRFSTACENFSIWGSQQSNIELATYICTTHTLHTNNTKSPTASSLCRVSGCGKWNYSPSYREESFSLSPFSWHFFCLQTELN